MPDQQDARLGQKVGKYRLVRKLGGGGFGTVYLAEDRRERMQVALKLLHIPQTSGEDLKSFINEARIIELCHPHIVPLFSFGISRNGLPFLVMEYAPEGTLRDRHPKGERIALPTIVSYVDQIASALQYAHDHQIIHRDVKPENILVGASGTLLVSDFGVAKFLEQSVQISRQTQVGTPMYMAPEQYMGQACFASDQYALAVAIYEWICGNRPFQGTALGLGVQHMNTPPPRLRDHLPGLSEEVEHVILKALAKAPEDRFERIEEMASALRSAVQLPVACSAPIEGENRVPLILPEQRSRLIEMPEALAHDPTEVAPIEPAIRTGDLPLSKHSIPGFSLALLGTRGRKHRPGKRFPLLIGGTLGLISLLITLILILRPMVFLQGESSATPITPQNTPTQQKQMTQKWIFLTNGRITTAPIMASKTLYVNSSSENGSKVYAIDTKSGLQKWAFPLDGSVTFSSTVQSETLYIGVSDKVYAIDTKSGLQKWVFPFDGYNIFPSPTVQNGILSNGILYVAAFSPNDQSSGKMYAIDTKTGHETWTFPIDGSLVYLLTVQNGTLYVGASSPGSRGGVYAIDIKTGLRIWAFPTDGLMVYSLTVQNGIPYIWVASPGSQTSGKVYAIDTKTGDNIWAFPIDGNGGSELLVQDGVVYVGAYSLDHTNSKVYAINAETGHEIWTFSSDGNDGSKLLVQDGVLYIGSASSSYSDVSSKEGKVDAVDAKNGHEIWAFPITGAVLFELSAQSGTLYIGLNPFFLSSSNPKIYAIDIKTGRMEWSSPTGGSYLSLPTAVNGELYAGSFDGAVYAWILPAPPSRASS